MQRGFELCMSATLSAFAALFVSVPANAAPQIPDVYVYDVGVNGGDTNDFAYYGQSGGIAAHVLDLGPARRARLQVRGLLRGGRLVDEPRDRFQSQMWHTSSPFGASRAGRSVRRMRARALNSWLFDVPAVMPSVSAISSCV